MKLKRSLLLAAVLALGLGVPAAHGDDTTQLDPIIVTARGRASQLSATPGGAAVADSDEIALHPKASAAYALEDIPGLSLTGDSVWGRDIAIRGLTGNSVVVLVDGHRINSAIDMNARLSFVNAMDIERIEVLKGPVSSLYGSGSTGGVVNIITRKGAFSDKCQAHGRVSLAASSNPQGGDAYASAHFDSPSLWLFASAAGQDHDDLRGGDDERIANSQFRDGQGRVASGFKLGQLTTQVQVMRMEANDVGLPGGPSTLPAVARVSYPRTSSTLASLDLTWDREGQALGQVAGSIYINQNERRVRVDRTGNAAVSAIEPGADHETLGGQLRANLDLGAHAIVGGVDAWQWTMDSWRRRFLTVGRVLYDNPVPHAVQTSAGVFAEDDWTLSDAFTLNLGARLDRLQTKNDAGNGFASGDESDLGWNVHAGLTHKISQAWSQTAIIASSYRAADVLERYKYIDLGGGQVLYGNPDLNPETSLFGEYGLHYQAKPFKGDLRLFANQLHDYISQKRISATRLEMCNVGQARIFGAELEGRLDLGHGLALFANATALDGRDENADEPLRYIAPISGMAGVDFVTGPFWARLDTRWALDQNETPADVEETGGYATLNLAGRYRFAALGLNHELLLTVDNILDTRYESYLSNARGIELLEPGVAAALTYTLEF
ncbi:TonB-dependent receptor plug [Desulfarculus baarsii DSM 2075]|uniref:TonB-dependent receptor plug n=1 Tax=Desulfarculus baarsii (strain ATCC 33931 / DSM 2075 / LMG 7858 / VKM B-1802 / 2st14) TaxID=644282 RepID=E1QFV6_DESB2|nr:TonB-dependent receptor [Desulfarculus baarsii]ADK84566.1 TonB-dependent receptor plug [Desulfarculus baarsii DSM 2075]